MIDRFILLSGKVSELAIVDGEQAILSPNQEAAGTAAAAALAAAGLAGVAAGTVTTVTAARDSVQFFQCKLDGRRVEGAVTKASFKEGDQVTAVVEEVGPDLFKAYAMCRPKDHLLWMAPHYSRGSTAHLLYSVRLSFLIGLVLAPIFAIWLWIRTSSYEHPEETLLLMGTIVSCVILMVSFYFAARFYRQWLPIARHAERVFSKLGFKNPQAIDLYRENSQYGRENGLKRPYLTDGPWIFHYSQSIHIQPTRPSDGTP